MSDAQRSPSAGDVARELSARPRTGEGVHTHAALEEPLLLDYDGMG